MKLLIRNAFWIFIAFGSTILLGALIYKAPMMGKVFSTVNASLISSNYSAPAPAAYDPSAEQVAALPPSAYVSDSSHVVQVPPPNAEVSESGQVVDVAANTSTMPGSMVVVQTGAEALTSAQANRMVIKNAEIGLLVKNTDDAINRALQVVGDVGGYIISSRVWFQESNGTNYKYATVTIGVPADQFESAMRRLRSLSIRVLDENASGQDVTDEYVDLQSQLGNLESTRDRIRSFLDNAQSVDESLRVNQELTNIEGQIEQVKGRMNYLANRSAYSTIAATFQPDIPPLPTLTPQPTFTPEPTITPSPTATPDVWDPGETFGAAKETVVSAYQIIIDVLIWVFVVLVPIALPFALIIWVVWMFTKPKK